MPNFNEKTTKFIFSRRRGPSYPYSCPHKNCGKVFSNLHRKNVHIAKTHINVDGKDCQMCGKKVTNSFDEHQRMFHKSKDCSDCNITFIGMKSLLEHQRKIHSDIHTCQVENQIVFFLLVAIKLMFCIFVQYSQSI